MSDQEQAEQYYASLIRQTRKKLRVASSLSESGSYSALVDSPSCFGASDEYGKDKEKLNACIACPSCLACERAILLKGRR